MNQYEFIIVLVAVILVFSIVRHKMGIPARSMRQMMGDEPEKEQQNAVLRAQVKQLQERIRILERIVTDRGVETAAQIEALRDRDQIEEEDKA